MSCGFTQSGTRKAANVCKLTSLYSDLNRSEDYKNFSLKLQRATEQQFNAEIERHNKNPAKGVPRKYNERSNIYYSRAGAFLALTVLN